MNWSAFCDHDYHGMWGVRADEDHSAFCRLVDREEAEALAKLLSQCRSEAESTAMGMWFIQNCAKPVRAVPD